MEQIVQEAILPKTQKHMPPLKVSPLVLIVLMLLIGFAVITVGKRTVAQYTVSLPDLFSSFADIFPGQPSNTIEGRGFLCVIIPYPAYSETCTLRPETGLFSQVEVILSEGVIYQTSFLMRANTLRFGDLEMPMGTTGFKANTYGIVFSWYESTGIASTLSGVRRSSPFVQCGRSRSWIPG